MSNYINIILPPITMVRGSQAPNSSQPPRSSYQYIGGGGGGGIPSSSY